MDLTSHLYCLIDTPFCYNNYDNCMWTNQKFVAPMFSMFEWTGVLKAFGNIKKHESLIWALLL